MSARLYLPTAGPCRRSPCRRSAHFFQSPLPTWYSILHDACLCLCVRVCVYVLFMHVRAMCTCSLCVLMFCVCVCAFACTCSSCLCHKYIAFAFVFVFHARPRTGDTNAVQLACWQPTAVKAPSATSPRWTYVWEAATAGAACRSTRRT
jgi:hypothetical protein